jgi:glyoxylase-like metal-dependent hydrolase (beta-lactamase superfamily II)
MISRRETIQLTAAAAAAAAVPTIASAQSKLKWQVFLGDGNAFHRTPILIEGDKAAVLIDGTFNYGHGDTVAKAVKKSGKQLTVIYVTINDPDYYFGNKPIITAYPNVKVLAAQSTVDAINKNVEGKLATWSPVLKQYGPATKADLTIPTASASNAINLEGNTLEIRNAPGLGDRGRYIYVPSLNAVFGGSLVFSGTHVWTADTGTVELRKAWMDALDAIIAMNPAILVPGHMTAGAPQGVAAAQYTKKYLVDFEDAVAKGKDAKEVIATMSKAYPKLAPDTAVFLEYGAKVAKGEMKWG